MTSSLVPLDLSGLETRLCTAAGCPNDAGPSGRCPRHALADLPEIARRAAAAHAASGASLHQAIEHGISCGEALLAAHAIIKGSALGWGKWLSENVAISDRYAYGYMRLALHRDALPPEAFAPYLDGRGRRREPSVSRAIEFTTHLPAVADKGDHFRLSDEKRAEVLRLHGLGIHNAEVARRVGVHHVTVARVVDPAFDRRKREAANRKQRNATAASRATSDAEIQQRLAAALADRPRLTEAYRLAGRLVDELAAAGPDFAKAHRYAKAARNGLVAALLEEGAP